MHIARILAISSNSAHINALFYMTVFYIHNPTQYLNLTTTLQTINKQQVMNLLREKS